MHINYPIAISVVAVLAIAAAVYWATRRAKTPAVGAQTPVATPVPGSDSKATDKPV